MPYVHADFRSGNAESEDMTTPRRRRHVCRWPRAVLRNTTLNRTPAGYAQVGNAQESLARIAGYRELAATPPDDDGATIRRVIP